MAVFDTLLLFQIIRMKLPLKYRDLRKQSKDQKRELVDSLRLRHEMVKQFFTSTIAIRNSEFNEVELRLKTLKEMIKELETLLPISENNEEFTLTMKEREAKKKQYQEEIISKEVSEQFEADQSQLEQSEEHSVNLDVENVNPDDSQYQQQLLRKQTYGQTQVIDSLDTYKIIFSMVFDKNGVSYGKNTEQLEEHDKAYRSVVFASLFNRKDIKLCMEKSEKTIELLLSNPNKSIEIQMKLAYTLYIYSLVYSGKEAIKTHSEGKHSKHKSRRNAVGINLEDPKEKKEEEQEAIEQHAATIQVTSKKQQVSLEQEDTKLIQIINHAIGIMLGFKSSNLDPMQFQLILLFMPLIQQYVPRIERYFITLFQKLLRNQIKIKKHIHNLQPIEQIHGQVEMRKQLLHDILKSEFYINNSEYKQVLLTLQKTLTQATQLGMRFNIMSGHALYQLGISNYLTLSLPTAMVNLEMSKNIYQLFFTSKIHLQIAKIDLVLGKVYFGLHDYDNALKCLGNAYFIRNQQKFLILSYFRYFDELDDQVLEIIVELLKIYVEQEETGTAIKFCIKYLKICDKLELQYRRKLLAVLPFKTKVFAKFNFIMGSIFLSAGSLVSPIRCFQRSIKAYQACRSSNYIQYMFIQHKVKECLKKINHKIREINNLSYTQTNIFQKQGFETMSDLVGNYFVSNSIQGQTTISGQTESKLCVEISIANMLYKEQQFEQAFKKYKDIVDVLKNEKKDEMYGSILQRIGELYLLQGSYQEALQYMKYSIELHSRFMHFPFREYNVIKCQIYLTIIYAVLGKVDDIIEIINEALIVIERFQRAIRWEELPQGSQTILPNKFSIMIRHQGSKIGYQVLIIIQLLATYKEFRKKIMDNIMNGALIKQLAIQEQETILGHSQNLQQLAMTRTSILQGYRVRVSIAASPMKQTKERGNNPALGEILSGIDEDVNSEEEDDFMNDLISDKNKKKEKPKPKPKPIEENKKIYKKEEEKKEKDKKQKESKREVERKKDDDKQSQKKVPEIKMAESKIVQRSVAQKSDQKIQSQVKGKKEEQKKSDSLSASKVSINPFQKVSRK